MVVYSGRDGETLPLVRLIKRYFREQCMEQVSNRQHSSFFQGFEEESSATLGRSSVRLLDGGASVEHLDGIRHGRRRVKLQGNATERTTLGQHGEAPQERRGRALMAPALVKDGE